MVARHPSRISPDRQEDLTSFKSYPNYNIYSGSARRPKADVGYGGKTNTRNVHTPDGCIYEFLNAKFRNAKKYTRDKCRWSLRRMTRILEAGGFDASPFKIDEDAVNYIMDEYRARGKLDSYLEGEIAYLNRYLKFFRNYTIVDMNPQFSQDMRVNVHWLEEDQYQTLMDVKKTPLQDIVIHLELCLGFRNAECCRLTLSDINDSGTKPHFNVRGKGRGNGKYRTVRFHRDTRAVLNRWLDERERIVQIARENIPHWQDPGYVLLWCHYKNHPDVGYYREHTGSLDDAVLDPLRPKVGFHFSNHDLRRTFGRRLYHAGVPIETISKFLGHESTAETLKYLGINLDDMDEGMKKLDAYDNKMGVKKR